MWEEFVPSKSHWTKEKINKLIAMRKSGKYTLQKLGDKYGITRERVRQILDREGISGSFAFAKWEGLKEHMRYDFTVNHMRLIDLVKKYRTSASVIKTMLGEAYRPNKYEIQEDYFDKIDSAKKAYLYGFLYSSASFGNNTIAVQKQLAYMPVFELLKSELSNTPIVSVAGYKHPSVRYLTYSQDMCKKLMDRGFVVRRTTTAKFFPTIPDHYTAEFLLGFWEGRGSIVEKVQLSKWISYDVNFFGGVNLLRYISELIARNTGVIPAKCGLQKGTKTAGPVLKYQRLNDVKTIMKFMTRQHPVLSLKKKEITERLLAAK